MTTPAHDQVFADALRKLERRAQATTRKFGLVLAQCESDRTRKRAFEQLELQNHRFGALEVHAEEGFGSFEERLERACREWPAVHVVGADELPPEAREAWIQGWNYHRERIAARCPSLVVVWLSEHAVNAFAEGAPDAWAWRTTVLDFGAAPVEPWLPVSSMFGGANLAGAAARIRALEAHLGRVDSGEVDEEETLVARLKLELAELYLRVGRVRDARALVEELSSSGLIKDPVASWRLRAALARARGDRKAYVGLVQEYRVLADTPGRTTTRMGLEILGDGLRYGLKSPQVIRAAKELRGVLEKQAKLYSDRSAILLARSLAARIMISEARFGVAAELLRELLPEVHDTGDEHLEVQVRLDIGYAEMEQGKLKAATAEFDLAANLASKIDEPGQRIRAQWMLARARTLDDSLEEARRLLECEVLPTAKALGADGQLVDGLALLAEVELRARRTERALSLAHEGLKLADSVDHFDSTIELAFIQVRGAIALGAFDLARPVLTSIVTQNAPVSRRHRDQAQKLLASLPPEAGAKPDEHDSEAYKPLAALDSMAREPTTLASVDDDGDEAG